MGPTQILKAIRQQSAVRIQAGLLMLMSVPAMAQFSPDQDAAFADNVGRPAGDLNLLIAGLIAAIIILGMGVISYSAYSRWTNGQLSAGAVASTALRASVLIIIAGIFLR